VRLHESVPTLSNLMLQFAGSNGAAVPCALYAKIVGVVPDKDSVYVVRFSSMSPEAGDLLRSRWTKGRVH
jgi:hypothetical protein